MKNGLIYWHPVIYRNAVQFFLYGKDFYSRYETISKLLPDSVSVADICCGDCFIYEFLKKKNIDYLGLDLNPKFVKHALKKGIKAELFNIYNSNVPASDYVIMQGSLYQFMPNHRMVIDKMFFAARRGIIISEPVKHMASSPNQLKAFLSNMVTRVNGNSFPARFSKPELLGLFRDYNANKIEETKCHTDLIGLFVK